MTYEYKIYTFNNRQAAFGRFWNTAYLCGHLLVVRDGKETPRTTFYQAGKYMGNRKT